MLIYGLLSAASAVSLLLLGRTIWALHRFAYRPINAQAAELPSVSICIAARNETHGLAQCLERVLKSDYQKLEILVLDDSSGDDTSLIIKSFAGAGVRFIAGKPLPADWLGKNHAYQTLIDEASGDFVLFLDVDTTIQSSTVSQLVNQLVANGKSMVSVLPRREDSYHASAIFGTMRYYWELLLASRKSPPAASALWVVSREKLSESGIGLANYGLSVRPERHLARQLQRSKDYYYLIGTRALGVGYEKRLSSQYETALRLYYPMSGRNFGRVLLSGLFLLLLLCPMAILLVGVWDQITGVWAAVTVLVTYVTFGMFIRRTYNPINWRIRLFMWPFLLVQEIILLGYSFLQYRFGTVTWKGRPVNSQPTRRDALHLNE